VTEASVRAEPPAEELGAPPEAWFGLRRYAVTAAFLAPALILLGVWVVYPAVYTIYRSFYGKSDGDFVGFDNYKALFTPFSLAENPILKAIENNAIWVAVVPAMITAIGLVFAVLIEKVSWSLAFKTAVFMPMAISLFAAGVIWRIMDRQEPQVGTVNAFIQVFHDAVNPPGPLSDALPSTESLQGSTSRGLVLKTPLRPGDVGLLGLTGIPPEQVPKGAAQAVVPKAAAGQIAGVVWRDFKPGGGTPGKVEKGELGLPNVTVQLRDSTGKAVESTKTEANGNFKFEDVSPGVYRAAIGPATFRRPFGGVSWLGSRLITPSVIIAYIWVWAGFAMVVIAAGLAAIPRDTLEAARTDGASEWQVFRRVTVPLLSPVLIVVLITMVINVLKVFDIVLSVAPESTQGDANVIALAMWRTAFTQFDFGLGAAIAVFLFLLVIPILVLNIRRFRREV
jgi:alpha-glucoside transport system permease protein